uniref:Uncharacterized protein n=1 Tax=Cannabis sativa TaxID=3483 RepID=A0A803NPR6_CANSA
MIVQTRRGNQTDIVDPMVTNMSMQTPENPRDPPRMAPGQVNTRPPIVGYGVTSSLAGFTPGMQETGNTSMAVEHTTPGTGIPSTLNT